MATATWNATCTGSFLIGSDWTVPDGVSPYDAFNMWIGVTSDALLYPDYQGIGWRAENLTSRPQTVQPLLGCSQNPPPPARAAATSPPPGVVRRIVTMPLGPNRSRNFSPGCRRGERMVAAGHAVAFYTKHPQSLRDMRGGRRA